MKINVRAAAVSAGLGALFLIVYPFCNWITSRRAHVDSIYFRWERHIPFVPALIIPYMSIDLFFVAAPFLTKSVIELRTLALRMGAAILIAGGCFLAFPLRFAFDRPHVAGFAGLIFNNFRSLDLPFNQCPSLHIALWTILLDLYLRRTPRLIRILVGIWFGLILISTVLTYQHHVVDVAGGFVLATLCFYLIRDQVPSKPRSCNPRVAIYYAIGAIGLFGLGFVAKPWSYLMIWPATSLGIMTAGYLVLGSNIYRKRDGKLPVSTLLILGPVLIGQRISLAYYSRQCRAYDRLTEHLWIGRRLSSSEAREACALEITAVVDMTGESSECESFRNLRYLQIPALDLTAPQPQQIDQAVNFIQRSINEGVVYLHCKAGYSRTAVIAGAYLLDSGKASTVAAAVEMLRKVRPTIIIRPEAMQALDQYAATRQSGETSPIVQDFARILSGDAPSPRGE